MMLYLQRTHTNSGNLAYVGSLQTLQAISRWVRELCLARHGPVVGEARYHELRAAEAFELWLARPQG